MKDYRAIRKAIKDKAQPKKEVETIKEEKPQEEPKKKKKKKITLKED